MANCSNCSAPLQANTNRCNYCDVRNDVDLQGKHDFNVTSKNSTRLCPHCNTAMQTVKLDLKDPFYIERCKTCFGLFFDPGEIEILLESSVSNIFSVNLKLITTINRDRYKKKQVKYVKCPICRVLMNRVNFGQRSGVIIDQCKKHGIWLDNGEVTHLMEWKKAGGELLHAQKKEKPNKRKKTSTPLLEANNFGSHQQYFNNVEEQLFDTVSSLIFRLFK